jgi:hypothetical protein
MHEEAAVAIILKKINGDFEILLIKRKQILKILGQETLHFLVEEKNKKITIF